MLKNLSFILMLGWLLVGTVKAKEPCYTIIQQGWRGVTLTDTEKKTLYILHKDATDQSYLDSSLPTLAGKPHTSIKRPLEWTALGDFYLNVLPSEGTGMSSAESDSLCLYIKPLIFNSYTGVYEEIKTDSTFLVIGTKGVYTSTTANWLDWNSAQMYGCLLTGQLWPTPGFVLYLWQKNYTSGASTVRVSYTYSANK